MNDFIPPFNSSSLIASGDLDEIGLLAGTQDVVEIPLLLAGWQITELERVAYLRGLTAAEMVRQLLSDFIAGQTDCHAQAY